MYILNYLSEITSIDSKYWILIFKTLVFWLIFDIAKRICIKVFKRIKDSKKEYLYTQKLKLIIVVLKLFILNILFYKITLQV